MPRAKKKPKHNAATRHMWKEQRERRKGRKPRKTVAAATAPPAVLSEAPSPQISMPVATSPAAAPTADRAHSFSLGVRAALAAAAAAGAYVVLYAAIEPIYHGTGAALRAVVPLAVEMIAGEVIYSLVMGKSLLGWYLRLPLVLVALVVIGACARAELDAAAAAPAAATRERVTAVYDHPTKVEKVEVSAAPEHEGPQARHQRERNEGAALALQGQREAAARQDLRDRLANAKQVIPGEGELTTLLALLGALGSACFMPLMEAFLRSLSRPVEAPKPAPAPATVPAPRQGFIRRGAYWPWRWFARRPQAAPSAA